MSVDPAQTQTPLVRVDERAEHFINIEQDTLCRALMREWLDRVEEAARADHVAGV